MGSRSNDILSWRIAYSKSPDMWESYEFKTFMTDIFGCVRLLVGVIMGIRQADGYVWKFILDVLKDQYRYF